jgi:hypothetical protein
MVTVLGIEEPEGPKGSRGSSLGHVHWTRTATLPYGVAYTTSDDEVSGSSPE